MSEDSSKLTVLARFGLPEEAHLVKNRLEAAGITAFLDDEGVVGLWNLGGALGSIKLMVPEEDLERAGQILDQVKANVLLPNPSAESEALEAEADRSRQEQLAGEHLLAEADQPNEASDLNSGADSWTCPGCRFQVGYEHGTCPRCGTSVELLDNPLFAAAGSEERTTARETESWAPMSEADQWAARAWRAAVFGMFLCFPFFSIYSLVMLLRLERSHGRLSPEGKLRCWGALLINAIVFGVIGFLVYTAFNPRSH
jgi:hypothetical protein